MSAWRAACSARHAEKEWGFEKASTSVGDSAWRGAEQAIENCLGVMEMVVLRDEMMARVLVIEDDSDNRLFLQELLRLNTHEVHTARDGRDALSWLQTQRLLPDCILLDLDMPIMTGQEFFRQLQNEPRFSRIRIIILSGDLHSYANDLPSVAACLEKPAPPEVLVDVVGQCASFRRGGTDRVRRPPPDH